MTEKLSKYDIEFLESKAKRSKLTYTISFAGLFLIAPLAIFVFVEEGVSWISFDMAFCVIALFFYGYNNRNRFKRIHEDLQNNFKEVGRDKITYAIYGNLNFYKVDLISYYMDKTALFEVDEIVKTNLAPISKIGLRLEKIE